MRTNNSHNTHIRPKNRTWLLPLLSALICGGVAFVVTMFLPKWYHSNASLYFPASSEGTSSLLSNLTSMSKNAPAKEPGGQVSLMYGALSSPQVASGPQTAIAVLTSRRCEERVCDVLNLPRKWDIPRNKAVKRLEGSVVFNVDKNGLLAMESSEMDRRLAADILNAYIKTLGDLAEELSLNISTRNRKFLENRIGRTRARLQVLEKRYAESSAKESPVLATSALPEAAKAVIEMEADLVKAKANLDAANGQLAFEQQAAEKVVALGSQFPSHALMGRDQRERVSDLEAQVAMDRAQYGPDKPERRRHEEQLKIARAQLQIEIQREGQALAKGIAPEVVTLNALKASAEAQVEGLSRALDEVKSRFDGLPMRVLQRERLLQEIKVMREIVAFQEAEAERARIAEARDATTFQVIDPPDVADEHFAPRKAFTSVLAAVAGLLIGVAFLVARGVMQEPRDPLLVRDPVLEEMEERKEGSRLIGKP
jgi:uncharacterized protein involved in exopolysaccharide biosynthesis